MGKTVERYFSLVDAAVEGPARVQGLADLFADDCILAPAQGESLSGNEAIERYLSDLYTNVTSVNRHFYNITSDDGRHVEADWAEAGRLKQGGLVALKDITTMRSETTERSRAFGSETPVNVAKTLMGHISNQQGGLGRQRQGREK
ncbi:nuclear transport factor 2-like protein [Paraburkholderia strydomiana]|uniref:hypothetical protein n=1 Tax=Paraburkholderia strydomiana TaxID=1245417 RepID=UPI0038B77442